MTLIVPEAQDASQTQRFRGAIDGLNEGWAFGWIVDVQSPRTPVEVRIFLYDEHVLTGLCTIARDDISALIGQPVTAGFSVPLADISPAAIQRLMARLKSDGAGAVQIAEILRVEVEDMPVAFSPSVGTIERETLFNAFAAQASQGQEGQAEGRQLRDDLLSVAPEGPDRLGVVAFYTAGQGAVPADWTAVATARPRFEGHHQPRLPGELGFYDVRVAQVHRDQAALARRYGVSAFCYEVYGTDSADAGLQAAEQHAALDLDLEFCHCWVVPDAGTDGGEHGAGARSYQSEIDVIQTFLPSFRSDSYLTIGGAPLLLVDGAHRLRHPAATIEHWRKKLRAEGFESLHVSIIEPPSDTTPAELGCDSSCQDPRRSTDNATCPALNATLGGLAPDHKGTVRAYADVVRREMARPAAPYLQFRTALPGWDETPRAGAAANILTGATPDLFQAWMTHLVTQAHRTQPEAARLVFVRSWNDWLSGACLEPDHDHERGFLRALRAGVAPQVAAYAALAPAPDGGPDPLAEARRLVESLIVANRILSELLTRSPVGLHDREDAHFVAVSPDLMQVERLSGEHFAIESLNGRPPVPGCEIPIAPWQGLALSGWFLINERSAPYAMLGLRSLDAEGSRYVASIPARQERADVATLLQLGARAHDCGVRIRASLDGVRPGRYELEFLVPSPLMPNRALAIALDQRVLVGLAQ